VAGQEKWEKAYDKARREVADRKQRRKRAKIKALSKRKRSSRIEKLQREDMSLTVEKAKCKLKNSFETKTKAWAKSLRSNVILRPYKCEHCELWHLTGKYRRRLRR